MISALLGDITLIPTEAIVNSANPSLLAGGGVCGAIHRVAGRKLEFSCRTIGKIEPGQAVITLAYNLPADYVIHAVAPRYFDGSRGEVATLAQTYTAICELIKSHAIATASIPSLGTGVYRFPLELAAEIATRTLRGCLPNSCAAQFVCFDADTLNAYRHWIT